MCGKIENYFEISKDSEQLFQATVYLLENLHVILTKFTDEDIKTDVLPMIFTALESSSIAIQVSNTSLLHRSVLHAVNNVKIYLHFSA